MSLFEGCVLFALAFIVFGLFSVVSVIEKSMRHLSNIANRLLDIEKALSERR